MCIHSCMCAQHMPTPPVLALPRLQALTQQQGSSTSPARGGLPDLPCSSSPVLQPQPAVALSAHGPFGCQQHQHAALDAFKSWEASQGGSGSGG